MARATRSRPVNLSVGVLLLLLVSSLILYRLGITAAEPALAGLPQPSELWRVPLGQDASGVACFGDLTYILTTDKLGAAALMVIDGKGLLIRTETLASTGRFELLASPLGVVCAGRDQGVIALYGAGGRRLWTVHLPGPATLIAADAHGLSVAISPQPGEKAGDRVVVITPDGRAATPVLFPYGAVTAICRGPHGSTAIAVFTADPAKAPEALVFLQADGQMVALPGRGFGSSLLTANDQLYIVGTTRGISAYDSRGERRWAVRISGARRVLAQTGVVIVADQNALTALATTGGERVWRRALATPASALAAGPDGPVITDEQGFVAFDLQGEPRWALPADGSAWSLGDDRLVVIQRETAIAYRTR
ncbi:MAG: PQQ-binding-like beta-propeller repeat protein [Chloroflexota bacterium]